jgi:hypothetical protein
MAENTSADIGTGLKINMRIQSDRTSTALTLLKALLLLLPLLLATPSKAYGYADPGSGAFLYQAAYAAVLGGSYYLRKFLGRIFRKRK